jgi:hypothetical protein
LSKQPDAREWERCQLDGKTIGNPILAKVAIGLGLTDPEEGREQEVIDIACKYLGLKE